MVKLSLVFSGLLGAPLALQAASLPPPVLAALPVCFLQPFLEVHLGGVLCPRGMIEAQHFGFGHQVSRSSGVSLLP